MTYRITLIPGDGIGPEISQATQRVIDALGVGIEWDVMEAGESAISRGGNPLPEEVRFIRSDQFSFVQQGIPAIHLKPGNKSTDLTIDAADMTRDWLRRIYHSPADDMSQKFDFQSGAKYVGTNLRLIRAIADAPQRPKWIEGDFFARTFAPR